MTLVLELIMQKKLQKHKSQWEVCVSLFFGIVFSGFFKGRVAVLARVAGEVCCELQSIGKRGFLWGLTAAIFTAGHSTIFVNSSNFHRVRTET